MQIKALLTCNTMLTSKYKGEKNIAFMYLNLAYPKNDIIRASNQNSKRLTWDSEYFANKCSLTLK